MAPRTQTTNRQLACLLTGLLAVVSLPVSANWTVVPDDLFPTSTIDAKRQPTQSTQSTQARDREELAYTIPFAKLSTFFTGKTKSVLNTVIEESYDGVNIRIAARPDIGEATGPLRGISQRRAINIRNYLIKNGIPASAISIDVDNTATPNKNDEPYSCTIYISKEAATRSRAIQRNSGYPAQTIPTQTDNSVFAQYVAESVQAGRISPEMAVYLLSAAQRAPSTQANPIYPIARPPVQVAAPPIPVTPTAITTTWDILETDITLQNTMARWGQLAGWKVKWIGIPEIRNPGRVSLTDRDFIAASDYVLKKAQIAAKTAGIAMHIKGFQNRVLIISNQEIK